MSVEEADAENLNAGIALTILLADILVLRISYTGLFKYDPDLSI
jgi:hypothetical protein